MGRTVLIGHPSTTWREWSRDDHLGHVCLDPSSAEHGPACRVTSSRDGRLQGWAFIGTLDAARQPMRLLEAAHALVQGLPDASVEVFAPRDAPVARQLALSVARILDPERLLVPEGSGLETWGWPIGAEPVACPSAHPPMVREAQRRSRWIELMESSVDHSVDLDDVAVEGARLGSGRRLDLDGWDGWAECTGGTLLVVGETDPDERQVMRWLDHAHAQRLVHVQTADYAGLLCSFAAQDGEDFGLGTVTSFDAVNRRLHVRSTAVQPAPVRILKLGSLRIGPQGKESGEAKPWAL